MPNKLVSGKAVRIIATLYHKVFSRITQKIVILCAWLFAAGGIVASNVMNLVHNIWKSKEFFPHAQFFKRGERGAHVLLYIQSIDPASLQVDIAFRFRQWLQEASDTVAEILNGELDKGGLDP